MVMRGGCMKSRTGLILAFFIIGITTLGVSAESSLSSLKFKDTEIATVLKAIEKKADQEGQRITIVATPEVFGLVTVDLENVDWKTAFKVILKMYDLGYTQDGNILTVSSLVKIVDDQKRDDDAIFATGGTRIEAFKLKHVEAADIAKMITPFLSKDGKVSVMDVVNKQGWGFSASTSGLMSVPDSGSAGSGSYTPSTTTQNTTKMTRTRILAVSDTPAVVRQVGKLIAEIDVAPKQVLIRAILLEVKKTNLYDLGLDWATSSEFKNNIPFVTGNIFPVTPNSFKPAEGTSMTPESSGFKFDVAKINGAQFEVALHALQENQDTNTLSTPTVLTMDGREATILVGKQYPILETTSSTNVNNTVGGSLSYYQNIGIQLRVVPQISGDNDEKVNLIVHPTVSNQNGTVDVKGGTTGNAVIAQYPIIDTREAETQMVIDDGDTVVLGGLLSDAKSKELMGVPYLSDIPLIGKLFDRLTKSGEKTNLLIFLTVKIVRPSTVLPADVLDRAKIDKMAKGI